jgi:hypothetical protein
MGGRSAGRVSLVGEGPLPEDPAPRDPMPEGLPVDVVMPSVYQTPAKGRCAFDTSRDRTAR